MLVAVVTLSVAVLFKVLWPRWPGMLFAMIVGSLTCLLLSGQQHGVHLLGRMPAHLPPLSLPDFSFDVIRALAPKGLAVALLGLIEALSIARSISMKSRQQIDGSQEFIGQGLSNIIGSFFSSYAGSGSFTRSGINYLAGAMTPLSAVFSAVILSVLLLLVAPLTEFLPIAAMGGIILLVAYNLIDMAHIRSILRTSWEETAVMLATFLATLFLDLEFAIYAGVLLSLVLYLNRTAHPRIANLVPNSNMTGFPLMEGGDECLNLKIIRIDGPLFFGAVNHVGESLAGIDKHSNHKRDVLILGCGINFIDVAGAEMLAREARRLHALRATLYLCEFKPEAYQVLERGGYIDIIGADHIFGTQTEALGRILPNVDPQRCQSCAMPLFKACRQKRKSQVI
jgi:SulP family sulfate permease